MANIKKQILVLALCMECFFFPVTASNEINHFTESEKVTKTDPIELKGNLQSSQLRSGGDALYAEIVGNTLLVTFNRNIGNLSVCIKNNFGNAVYSTTVNSNSGYAVIPLSGLPSGTYTITFSNGNGAMWGQFSI